jgi:hypothetical protein
MHTNKKQANKQTSKQASKQSINQINKETEQQTNKQNKNLTLAYAKVSVAAEDAHPELLCEQSNPLELCRARLCIRHLALEVESAQAELLRPVDHKLACKLSANTTEKNNNKIKTK